MGLDLKRSVEIKNKKASFLYEFIEKFTTGIELTGTEIKAIREGKANLVDAYCSFANHELWISGMHISEYSMGTYNNHDPKRERKLLMTRKELNKLEKKIQDKGLTIIATKLFINEKGWAKLVIALARGKKHFDKREDIKQKDSKRELDRLKKNYN